MLTLYHRTNGQIVAYHEAWVDGPSIIAHWGPIGDPGAHREHPRDPLLTDDQNIQRILAPALASGFAPISPDEHALLRIKYSLAGLNRAQALEKLRGVDAHVNERLGATGLGHCDGSSLDSGTMEICCYVVDFGLAKAMLEDDLCTTPFADHQRIYADAQIPAPVPPPAAANPRLTTLARQHRGHQVTQCLAIVLTMLLWLVISAIDPLSTEAMGCVYGFTVLGVGVTAQCHKSLRTLERQMAQARGEQP